MLAIAVLALRGVAAVFVLATLVGGIPRTVQGALAIVTGLWAALVVATSPAAPAWVGEPLALDSAIVLAARELVLGAALGVVAALPLLAANAAGRIVDFAGRARGPYRTLFGVLAAAVFVGVDGHVAAITALVDSYRASDLDAARVNVLAAIVALIPAAIRLAIPWLVTAAVVEIAVGAGARVAGRAGAHVPLAAATPAALAMMTAALIGSLAVAIAHLVH